MQKDLKIGFGLGLAIVAVLGFLLATKSNIGTRALLRQLQAPADENSPTGQRPESSKAPEKSLTGNQPYSAAAKTAEKKLDDTITTEKPFRPKQQNQTGAIEDTNVKKENPTIIHIIKKGETLSQISKQYYGTENEWRKIFDANRNRIIDANKLRPGTRIIIPK